MLNVFEVPADLVGQIAPGDVLIDDRGHLLLVGQPVNPKHFREQAAVTGQHYLELFGSEIEYVPGGHDPGDVVWPLRRVRVVVVEEDVRGG